MGMPWRASTSFKKVWDVEPICETATVRPRSSGTVRMPACGLAMILN
jgi:hypothetical protein